jgi:hypothetical protein
MIRDRASIQKEQTHGTTHLSHDMVSSSVQRGFWPDFIESY